VKEFVKCKHGRPFAWAQSLCGVPVEFSPNVSLKQFLEKIYFFSSNFNLLEEQIAALRKDMLSQLYVNSVSVKASYSPKAQALFSDMVAYKTKCRLSQFTQCSADVFKVSLFSCVVVIMFVCRKNLLMLTGKLRIHFAITKLS
jgi:hypothetical protein